jgi:hypothetical protein
MSCAALAEIRDVDIGWLSWKLVIFNLYVIARIKSGVGELNISCGNSMITCLICVILETHVQWFTHLWLVCLAPWRFVVARTIRGAGEVPGTANGLGRQREEDRR